ncbi:MAG: hypothetical protein JJU36_05505 [Phycisphaeraceae bacterium]|nr:hypothetical protein [Phycisphaeraceae bacterium]
MNTRPTAINTMLAATAILFLLVGTMSCSSRPGVNTRFGERVQYFNHPADDVYHAAQRAAARVELMPISQSPGSQGGGTLRYRDFQDTRVTFRVNPEAGTTSRVNIRITGRSEGFATRLLSLITEELGATHPAS